MKNNTPLISVIIPNYNHAKFLTERIESVLQQSYQNIEVILLDDCSTDHSVEILNKYKNHTLVSHLITNKINSGTPFKQWIKGISLSRGDYIWIAESDDIAHPNFLESLLIHFKNDLNLTIACVGSDFIDSEGNNIKDESVYKDLIKRNGQEEIKIGLSYLCTIQNASAVLFKKPKKIPYIISNYQYCGDWFFWSFLLRNGNFIYVPEKLNKFRRHANNVSFKSEKEGLWFKEGFKIMKDNLKHINYGNKEKLDLVKYWQKKFFLYKHGDTFSSYEIISYVFFFFKLDLKVGLNTLKYLLANWKYHILKNINE
jgi:glycosyltransferase involved in cell wall biosynthesis